jgi:hypothetical protein
VCFFSEALFGILKIRLLKKALGQTLHCTKMLTPFSADFYDLPKKDLANYLFSIRKIILLKKRSRHPFGKILSNQTNRVPAYQE